jgi:hypothetical protein
VEEISNEAVAINRLTIDFTLINIQKKWLNRVNQLYKLLLGLLSGMTLLMSIMLYPLKPE